MTRNLEVTCDACGEKISLNLEQQKSGEKNVVRIAVLHGEKPHLLIVHVNLENLKVIGKETTSYVVRKEISLPKTSMAISMTDYRDARKDLKLLVESFVSLLIGYKVKIERELIKNLDSFIETLKSCISIKHNVGDKFIELEPIEPLVKENIGESALTKKNPVNKDIKLDRDSLLNSLSRLNNLEAIIYNLREINRVTKSLANILEEVTFVTPNILKNIVKTSEETFNIALQILENIYKDINKKIIKYGLDLLI